MFFYLIFASLSAPGETGEQPPIIQPRTPLSTPFPTRTQYVIDRGQVVVPEEPKTEDNLLIAFIVLVCVLVVGAIAVTVYFIVRKNKKGQVGAEDSVDQKEPSAAGTSARSGTSTMHRPGTSHTIYSVNTVVL